MVEQSGAMRMSEQEELDDNIQETPADSQEPEAAQEASNESDDSGSDGGERKFDPKAFVKIDDPAVQAKFNDIYKQTKMSDARNQVLTKLLVEQQKQLDEFKSRFNQTDHAEASRILNSRLKEARDAGDDVAVDRIQQEIIDFKVDMKINDLQKKIAQPQKPELIVDDQEAVYIDRLARETDQTGAPIRPWMDEGHPEHEKAIKVAMYMAQKYESEHGYRDVPEIMKRIDAAMGKNKTPGNKQANANRGPDPFSGGNLTNRRPDHKLKLSDAEKEIARKLGLSEKDYLANR